jgi:hypothetical protein
MGGSSATGSATTDSASAPGTSSATGSPSAAEGSSGTECRDLGLTVSFKRGSSKLDTNAKGALDGVSEWMHKKDDRTLKLQGFTDTTGDTSANLKLSEKRADAARAYLVNRGVEESRISTVGRGEESTETTLPAQGRTVTFLGCAPATPVAMVTPPPPPPEPEAAPPPAPEPVAPVEEVPPPPPVAETPPPPPATPYEAGPMGPRYYGSTIGFGLLVGGGYTDFTHTNARALTNAGGSWDARMIVGMRSFIGLEAAYVGSAQNVQGLGLNNSTLIGNGVEGALRVQVPIAMHFALLEPYGFAGIGWTRYHVTNNVPVFSDFSGANDDVMTVPLGGGISYAYKAFLIDARGSWTPTYYNNILLTTSGNNRLDHWGVGGHVGVLF